MPVPVMLHYTGSTRLRAGITVSLHMKTCFGEVLSEACLCNAGQDAASFDPVSRKYACTGMEAKGVTW